MVFGVFWVWGQHFGFRVLLGFWVLGLGYVGFHTCERQRGQARTGRPMILWGFGFRV